jgi:hypothetical protein
MTIFNSYVKLPEGTSDWYPQHCAAEATWSIPKSNLLNPLQRFKLLKAYPLEMTNSLLSKIAIYFVYFIHPKMIIFQFANC